MKDCDSTYSRIGILFMSNLLLIGGGVFLLIQAFYVLPWLLSIVSAISLLLWWLILIPLIGTVLGLGISYVIKRVIISKESPHHNNPVITIGSVSVGWLIVLISSFG